MKWIKYKYVCGKDSNGNEVLAKKKVGYNESNLAIAETEAYDGYTIEEDETDFSSTPTFPGDIDMAGHKIKNLGLPTEDTDAISLGETKNLIASAITDKTQLTPEFVSSIDECTDVDKLYVIDGYIYAYMSGQWTNTGNAFVPTDYEDRILDIEDEIYQARKRPNGREYANLWYRLKADYDEVQETIADEFGGVKTDILLVSKKATANSEQTAVLKAKSIEDMTDVEKMYALPNGEMYVCDVSENLADPTSSEWCTNARLATVYGNSKECTGSILTNYIPVKVGDILRVKGLNLFGNNSTHNSTIASYSSKDIIADGTGKLEAYLMYKITSLNVEQSIDGVKNVISRDGDTYVYTIFERGDGTQVSYATDIAYIRISAPLAEGYTAENVVITVSEGWKSVHKALENKVEDDISRKIDKNQGIENVGKILVVGADGNIILADMPNGGSNGDVTGYLDTDNNIRLSGNLASGRYTLKYEYEDGTVAEVGTIEVGAIPEPTEPTNFADTSSSDWLTDYRLSFNGTELTTKELTGAICTNFVADIQTDDIVRVEGIDFTDTNNRQALVKENGTIIAVDNAMNLPGYSTHITNVTYDSNTLQFTVANTEQLKKLRFSGTLTDTADDVKITITRNGTVL